VDQTPTGERVVRVDFDSAQPDKFPHDAFVFFEPFQPRDKKRNDDSEAPVLAACHAYYTSAVRVRRREAKISKQREFMI
jgi:hypothetical protein